MGRLQGAALKHQYAFINSKAKFPALVAGLGCVRGGTKVYTEYGLVPIESITPSTRLLSVNHQTGQLELQVSSGSFPKGVANMLRVSTPQGEFEATEHHQIFSFDYTYQSLGELNRISLEDHHKIDIPQLSRSLINSTMESDQLSFLSSTVHCSQIDEDFLFNYGVLARLFGQLLLLHEGIDLSSFPLAYDVLEYASDFYHQLSKDTKLKHIRKGLFDDPAYKQGYVSLLLELVEALVNPTLTVNSERISDFLNRVQKFHPMSYGHYNTETHSLVDNSLAYQSRNLSQSSVSDPSHNTLNNLCSITDLGVEDAYWDIQVINNNNYITEDGTIHHNSGKTEALVYRTLTFLTHIPKAKIGIYEPTVDLIKRIIYPRFEDIFENSGIIFKLNKSDGIMQVWMPNGVCEIIFRSMDNYSRIIGYETHHAILDEIDTIPKEKAMEVWVRVLARNRKRFKSQSGENGKNTVGITTTPEGFNFVYSMWVKKHADNPDYELIKGRTTDNHHLPEDYVATLYATYPPQLIDAYINGEFVNLKGMTVYSGFNRIKSNTNLTMYDFKESDTIHIGMDFNIGRMSAVIAMKGDNESKNIYIVDEFHNLMDTPEMILAISNKYQGRTIVIYPDASGRSRKSVDASKSDIRLLRDAGFRINAPKKNPPVRERTLSMNTMFLNSEGDRYLFVNVSKCPNLTEALEKQVYDDNGIPIKDGKEDINDACGYLINRINGLARPQVSIGKMKLI